MLASVVSDSESFFIFKFLFALCFHLKIKPKLSILFFLQIDGQTKRQNQTIKQYLQSYENYQQDYWVLQLAMTEFSYSNNVHSFTKETLFYLEYKTHIQMPDSLQFSLSINVRLLCKLVEILVNLCLHWDNWWLESR